MPSEATINELLKIYRDAGKRLRQTVLHPPGDLSAPITKARAASILNQVNDQVASLKKQGHLWTGKAMTQSVKEGVAQANAQAAEAGVRSGIGIPADGPSLQGRFDLVNTRAVEVLARDTAADIAKGADGMQRLAASTINQVSDLGLSVREVNQILAGRGIIEGQPVQAIKALRDKLEAIHGEKVPVPCKDGVTREYDTDYYAEMIARTKTRQAVVTAKHETFHEMGIDLVKVIGRISPYFCTSYVGHIYSLEPGHKRFAWIGDLEVRGVAAPGPPFHPNCSKSTIPYIQGLTKAGFAGRHAA